MYNVQIVDGDKTKEGESSKDNVDTADKNGRAASPETKSSKRRLV